MTPAPPPFFITPQSTPTPIVFSAGTPARMNVSVTRRFPADGGAQIELVAHFTDAQGRPTRFVHGGDVSFSGDLPVQWQTRALLGGPAARFTVMRPGIAHITVRVNAPAGIAPQAFAIDTRGWSGSGATALGPHLVRVGWFPALHAPADVVREGDGGAVTTIARIPTGATHIDDDSVTPGARYRYRVRATTPIVADVRVPSALPATTLAPYRGVGIWLAFSPASEDPDTIDRLDPDAVAAFAAAHQVRSVVLRFAYGTYWEVDRRAQPRVDRLIEALAARKIATVAWVVPRSASAEEVATATRAGGYRTASGTRVAGLSLDLERGGEYFGGGASASRAMRTFVADLRRAVGPGVALVATLEDPYANRLAPTDVPFAEIAARVDALQPMAYWRMLGTARTPEAAATAMRRAIETTRRYAGRAIPIVAGAQSADLGPGGEPPPQEIHAALAAAGAAGAIGVTLFSWSGTSATGWSVVAPSDR